MTIEFFDTSVSAPELCERSCRNVCTEAVLAADTRGLLTSMNSGAALLLGVSSDEVLGKPFHVLLAGGPDEEARIRSRLAEGRPVEILETSLVSNKRGVFPVRMAASELRTDEGDPAGLIAICHDISDLKNLETELQQKDQFFASIVRNSGDAILTLDANERITSWNKGAEDMFGYTESEMLGQSFEILMPPRLKEQKELERISEIVRATGVLRSYRTQRVNKQGQLLEVMFTRTAILDGQGRMVGFCSVIKDVTEQLLVDRHLAQMEKLSAIGELSAGLAHEIKNPLAGIKGAIEIIRDGMDEKDPNRMILTEVLAEVGRIDRTVMSLLSFSRPRMGEFTQLDLVAIIAGVASFLHKVRDAQRVVFRFDHPEELPRITGDEHEIRQLFMNLFLNAIEVMPEGGRLSVRVECLPSSTLRVVVQDEGPGIPQENLPRVFKPFFTTKSQGTGLGLATCKRIVNHHGGDIRVFSKVGKGTRFVIDLPLNWTVPMSLSES
ncbi:MAG: PAS domain S-box protein [Acidobacteriota bacterium]